MPVLRKFIRTQQGWRNFMMEELKVNPAKIKIIGKGSSNGIDTDFFRRTGELESQAITIRKQFGAGPDDVVFSFVGRIVRDKGIVELVKAFKAVTDQLRDKVLPDGSVRRAFLLLVGPFEQALDPLPNDVVTFLGERQTGDSGQVSNGMFVRG